MFSGTNGNLSNEHITSSLKNQNRDLEAFRGHYIYSYFPPGETDGIPPKIQPLAVIQRKLYHDLFNLILCLLANLIALPILGFYAIPIVTEFTNKPILPVPLPRTAWRGQNVHVHFTSGRRRGSDQADDYMCTMFGVSLP